VPRFVLLALKQVYGKTPLNRFKPENAMKLIVTANEQKIGIVSFDSESGLFGFDYAPDWLAQAQRYL
jgi:hypothetical protein